MLACAPSASFKRRRCSANLSNSNLALSSAVFLEVFPAPFNTSRSLKFKTDQASQPSFVKIPPCGAKLDLQQNQAT